MAAKIVKKMKTKTLYRTAQIDHTRVDKDERTVDLSFSSEDPYKRFFGVEILDHGKKSVRLDRLNKSGPLLVNHDVDDQVGVILKASLSSDRRGLASVRFGRSGRAEEIFNDVQDGIRANVSVGYRVHRMVLEESDDEGGDTYRVTDWEPLEVSIVAVPADTTVGVGRDDETEFITEVVTMPKEEKKTNEPQVIEKTVEVKVADPEAIKAAEKDAIKQERERVEGLTVLRGRFPEYQSDIDRAISDGTPLADVNDLLIRKLGKDETRPISVDDPLIGLTKQETQRFSFLRAIRAQAEKNWSIAPFEAECSKAVAEKLGKSPQGCFVPMDVLQQRAEDLVRDLNVTTATAGGNLVATDLLSGSFIELLRNRMMVRQLGAITLAGLVGDVAIPKQTGGATAYWVAESGDPTESQQTIGQVTMAPKTVGAFTDISRKLLLQSSIDVEQFVKVDLATVLALAIDLGAINGSGASNQPTGVINTNGIGSVAGGTNGLAPAWSHIVDLETEVAIDNADVGALAYLTNAKVRGKLKQTDIGTDTGQMVWQGGNRPGEGMTNGYLAAVSNQVPDDLDKGTSTGVCSAILFGNWRDLLIGMWGTLDLLVDPYTGSTSGTVRVVTLQDIDIAVRHAESFAAMLDALTA